MDLDLILDLILGAGGRTKSSQNLGIAEIGLIGMASPGAQNPGFWEKSNLVMLVMW